MTRKTARFCSISRKSAETQAVGATSSVFEKFKEAYGLAALSYPVGLTHDNADGVRWSQVHGGRGIIDVTSAFREEEVAESALLLTYSISHGASEGVHTHCRDDADEGSRDEFYYIISGRGEM